jgi:hypothetical protein
LDTEPGSIYVDAQNPQASDGNPGTADLPLKTISKAAEKGLSKIQEGIATTIWILPGTYRERVFLQPDATAAAALTFRATEFGKAILSGSDVWTGWQKSGAIYSHPWPYKFGSPCPAGWPPSVCPTELGKRREMIFVNGQALAQVLSQNQMKETTFYVDEQGQKVYIWPPAGTAMDTATVEVAVRGSLFMADGATDLTIRGLVFQHSTDAIDDSAVTFSNGANILIEDSVFQWNNWSGLDLCCSVNVTLRRTVANHNGGRGMSAWHLKTVLYEDVETSYNNWRGALGGFTGWTVAGFKGMGIHNGTFRRHRAVNNQTGGLWFDTDNVNVRVEDSFLCRNRGDVTIEASQGPVAIVGTTICQNQEYGLIAAWSQNVTLQQTILYGNGASQIAVAATTDVDEMVTNWETGQSMLVKARDWTLTCNAVAGKSSSESALQTPNWDFFLQSLTSTKNLWWNPPVAIDFWVDTQGMNLGGWQSLTGQDADSIHADPKFTDPNNDDFTPHPGSPWPLC